MTWTICRFGSSPVSRGDERAVRPTRRAADACPLRSRVFARAGSPPYSADTAARTCSAWPSTFTRGKTLRTTPSPSITKVERIVPTVFFP